MTSNVPSPCIQICTIRDGVCIGCKRTLAEIASWSNMSDDDKLTILERLFEDEED